LKVKAIAVYLLCGVLTQGAVFAASSKDEASEITLQKPPSSFSEHNSLEKIMEKALLTLKKIDLFEESAKQNASQVAFKRSSEICKRESATLKALLQSKALFENSDGIKSTKRLQRLVKLLEKKSKDYSVSQISKAQMNEMEEFEKYITSAAQTIAKRAGKTPEQLKNLSLKRSFRRNDTKTPLWGSFSMIFKKAERLKHEIDMSCRNNCYMTAEQRRIENLWSNLNISYSALTSLKDDSGMQEILEEVQKGAERTSAEKLSSQLENSILEKFGLTVDLSFSKWQKIKKTASNTP